MHKYQLSESAKNFLNSTLLGKNPIKSVALEGPAGCGKTSLAEYVHEKLGARSREFFRFVCSKNTTTRDLLLDKTVTKGTITEIMQKFLEVYTKGGVILLDEWRLAPADVIAALVAMFDHANEWTSPDGRIFNRHKDCFVLFASNPTTYAGVKRQHEGFFDRLPTLNMGYPDDEQGILEEEFPNGDKALMAQLVEFARHVRSAHQAKGVTTIVSTRGLISILTMIDNGANLEDALQYSIKIVPDDMAIISDLSKLVFNLKPIEVSKGKFVLDVLKDTAKQLKEARDSAKHAQEQAAASKKQFDELINKIKEQAKLLGSAVGA